MSLYIESKNNLENHRFLKQLYIQVVFNFIILVLLALPYLSYIENNNEVKAKIYFFATTFSHFFLLAVIPFLFAILLYSITKSTKVAGIIYSFLTVLLLVILKIDVNIFSQFRYHISPIVLSLLFGKRSSDIFQFSDANTITAVLFLVGIVALQFFIYFISKKILSRNLNLQIAKTVSIFIICLLYSHFMFAWAYANHYRPVLQYKNVYPAFFPLTAGSLMTKLGLVNQELIEKNKNISQNQSQNIIKYPLKPIVSIPLETKKDILFIVIDSWRFDCLSREITPNLIQFAAQSQVFTNHQSGSNMTTGGVFSLFYGIPATYYDSFTGIEKSPVLIDELQKQNYEINVFSSSTLENPAFNRNVFSKIEKLRLYSDGDSPDERDQDITHDWLLNFSKRNSSKPSFDFIFYDAAHGFDYPESYKIPFKPSLEEVDYLAFNDNYDATAFINRYKNSLHFIDKEIGKVLEHLRKEKKLQNTIIVITGDHGQEFNDNKKGYWQHGGNFSKFQIQVPMLIYDADRVAQQYSHLTLHYDIVPMIMQNYLGVKNNLSDYSVGQNIFDNKKRDWFVSGYNQKYSVIESDKITNIYASGSFDITDLQLNTLNQDLNYEVIQRAFTETNKFYIKRR